MTHLSGRTILSFCATLLMTQLCLGEQHLIFDRLDANQSGTIEITEIDREDKFIFHRLIRTSDIDGDGRISRQ